MRNRAKEKVDYCIWNNYRRSGKQQPIEIDNSNSSNALVRIYRFLRKINLRRFR